MAESRPMERNLPLTDEEYDALISLIDEKGHAGEKGPFESGALPDSLFDKIMEKCGYEYDDWDFLPFDRLDPVPPPAEAPHPTERMEFEASLFGTLPDQDGVMVQMIAKIADEMAIARFLYQKLRVTIERVKDGDSGG